MLKMFLFYSSLKLLCCVIMIGEAHAFNMSQLLTSSYAQVSRSGAASKTPENQGSGRSSGQTPWTQSSDVHVVRGQNLPRRKNQRPSNKNDNDNIGEVIQERFNPKPWFGYEPNNNNNNKGPTYIPPPSSSSSATNTNNDKPSSSQDLTVPFDSFPLSLKPDGPDNSGTSDDNNPPKNTYGSMYTSYDPPPAAAPAFNQKNPDNFVTYEPPAKMIKPPKYLPPPPEEPSNPPENTKYMPETSDDGPPINEAYDHPYHHHHHNYQQQDTSMKNEEENLKFPGLPAYLDHDPNEGYSNYYSYHHHPDIDNGPPIYHEVKTTTEAAAEDQRLNKKPYSYYYLGRKLWHKITFNHYFEEDKREMKDVVTMPPPHHYHHDHDHDIHELGDHVWDNIHAARRKYIM